MKKSICINAINSTDWIGGLYYKRNMLYSLLQNQNITNEYNLVVWTNEESVEVFNDMRQDVILCVCHSNNKFIRFLQLITVCRRYNVKYIFPIENNEVLRRLGVNAISWIPDFQHCHYPEFFSEEAIRNRNEKYRRIASGQYLVLSSEDAKKDFLHFFPNYSCRIAVVPFVSYIEKMVRSLDYEKEKKFLQSHNLTQYCYYCVCNQFWKHKNHIVVFKAIKELAIKGLASNVKFVFTGQMSDDRNPAYINELRKYADDPLIKNRIIILGFLPREDQLIIIKNAKAVIQPSLFEGWGTVVEDSKVLDKTIFLSDISVHREQKSDKCILFNPNDYMELADIILNDIPRSLEENIEIGIQDMKIRANHYSVGFEQLLMEE